MEEFVSGYCRVLDAARTVLVDLQEQSVDCCYPDCPHSGECSIAAAFAPMLRAGEQ